MNEQMTELGAGSRMKWCFAHEEEVKEWELAVPEGVGLCGVSRGFESQGPCDITDAKVVRDDG